ncbi:MAG: type IV secretion system protein [Alphaproteobacteria bacterium]|nr:type IV secretion system protein [Alphaproteobacteria bacterium]
MLVVAAVLVYIFWYFHAPEVRNMVRWIRYGEMWMVSWFVGDDYTVQYDGKEFPWKDGFEFTPEWEKNALRYSHLAYINALAMQPLKFVFIGLLALGFFWALFLGPNTQYRRRLDLEGLIRRQSGNFPVISPFVTFNPGTQPARAPGSPVPAELPSFAEALGPEEWIAYNHIPIHDNKIDEAAVADAFATQLGERWKGPGGLAPYQQVLLAAFALKSSRKRKDADAMLGRLARCWTFKGGLKLSRDRKLLREARSILKDQKLAGKILAQCNRHAFVTTALLRALDFARSEGGVLAPAQFVWLRAHDRALWYPLNNMGRQSFHMEAMGAMAHYKAEKMTQRPIPVPKVQDAVSTLKEYMGSLRARPIPQLDYSGSKKRGVKMAK